MTQVCLIRPPRVLFKGYFTSGEAIPPLGLAYLASSLENSNFKVKVIDAIGENINQRYSFENEDEVTIQGMKLEEIVNSIPSDSILIGISCMFSCEWFLDEELIKLIKAKYPHIPIVLGGEHVTAEAENIFKVTPFVDVCVRGEGEETIIELATLISLNSPIDNVKGIVYQKNGKIIKNAGRDRIKHIDHIPNPNWDLFPIAAYLNAGNSMTAKNRRAMPIIASRGCPYRCTFCSSPQMWGTDLNLRSPSLVVEEIKYYKNKYNIEHIDFVDLVGFMNRAWVKELLTLMLQADLKISWILGAGTRSEILDEEILILFKKTNVLRIFYAPESGSKETLKRIQKRVNLKKMVASMKMARKLDISMRAPIIYGFPNQTLKEAFQSLFFSFKLSFIGVDDVVAHAFSAHPGSQLYYELVKENSIDIDNLIKEKKYNLFLQREFTSNMFYLHSWSKSIPNWMIPTFQILGMFTSYVILYIFNPLKIFKIYSRVFKNKKPLTVPEHVIFGILKKI